MNRPATPPPASSWPVYAVIAAALIALGIWYWWPKTPTLTAPPQGSPPVSSAPAAEEPPPAPAAEASEPTVEHPIEDAPATAVAQAEPLPSLPESDSRMKRALSALLGREPVLTWLQTDGFVNRVVTTVDNLGRAHAAPRLWPVNPIAGRFTVAGSGDDARISDENAARYESFIAFVDKVDVARAASLYKGMYPLYQRAYEDLGYPKRNFNDRLVEVIDLLLATPQPPEPPRVALTEVKGPVPSERPWVRYEYADTTLEARPAGQKIMLRLSPAQQQRVRAKLIALRAQIAAPPAAAQAASR